MTKNRGQLFEEFLVKFYNVAKTDYFPCASGDAKPDFFLPDGRAVQAKADRGTIKVPRGVATPHSRDDASESTIAQETYKAVKWWLETDAADWFALERRDNSTDGWGWYLLPREIMEDLTSTPSKATKLFTLTRTSKGAPQLKLKSMKSHLKRYTEYLTQA